MTTPSPAPHRRGSRGEPAAEVGATRRVGVWVFVTAALAAGCGDDDSASGRPDASPTESSVVGSPGNTGAENRSLLPLTDAPQGLAAVVLPDHTDDITALFAQLPPNLAGRPRTDEPSDTEEANIVASYGSTEPVQCGMVGLQAENVATGDFYPPGTTAETVVADFAAGTDWSVGDHGRDDDLVWVEIDTTCSSEGSVDEDSIAAIIWGNEGSPWVFSATAGDGEGRNELVAAFVAASS